MEHPHPTPVHQQEAEDEVVDPVAEEGVATVTAVEAITVDGFCQQVISKETHQK